ncbi:MAG: galactokinase, partial [Calditrichia bacterium]|nr:galactokinase [Calditrichia bacterium]
EMKAVAKELGGRVCRDLSIQQLLPKINTLRAKIGDRAVLRALHFLSDNQRVVEQVTALENGDFKSFLSLVSESGNSSFKWLQNCYSTKDINSQGIPLALALTENYFQNNIMGACRVHGGGFAGTIQVFIPTEKVPDYLILMESVFGDNSVNVLNIRQTGTAYLGFWDDIS